MPADMTISLNNTMAKKSSSKSSSIPVPPPYELASQVVPKEPRKPWKWIIIGLVSLLLVLVLTNKGLLLAAVVDGKPIFSWDLNRTLRLRYGQQTLEGMIGEMLIAKEAQKAGIVISSEDIEQKQKEILSSLGTEVKLDDFLKFQGMTKTDFNQQLRVQLTVEKLLTKNLTITDADINAYIATNRAMLVATDPATLKEEARKAIVGDTVSEKLQSWFVEVRQKAAVTKFL